MEYNATECTKNKQTLNSGGVSQYSDYAFVCEEVESYDSLSIDNVEQIYDRLQDDVSREIFRERLLLSITRDISFGARFVDTNPKARKFMDDMAKYDKVYIYGAGKRGFKLAAMFPNVNWCAFIDSSKKGVYCGLPIVSAEAAELEENAVVIVSNMKGWGDIRENLVSRGISRNAIICVEEESEKFCEDMYFDREIIREKLCGGFVDCGAYNGNDTERFIRHQRGEDAKAIILEPDEANYRNINVKFESCTNVKVLNEAVSDKSEIIGFSDGASELSARCDKCDTHVQAEPIDDVVTRIWGEDRVAMIKMDIEGAEYDAITGAKETIMKNHPVLAISIYHRRGDILKIPELILSYDESYRFYLRHYSLSNIDTVLYAI